MFWKFFFLEFVYHLSLVMHFSVLLEIFVKVYFVFTLRHLIYHPVILDASIHRGPWIIQKIASPLLYKPIYDPIVIAILILHLNMKNAEMKEKIYKNLYILKAKVSRWNKKHFWQFFNDFTW